MPPRLRPPAPRSAAMSPPRSVLPGVTSARPLGHTRQRSATVSEHHRCLRALPPRCPSRAPRRVATSATGHGRHRQLRVRLPRCPSREARSSARSAIAHGLRRLLPAMPPKCPARVSRCGARLETAPGGGTARRRNALVRLRARLPRCPSRPPWSAARSASARGLHRRLPATPPKCPTRVSRCWAKLGTAPGGGTARRRNAAARLSAANRASAARRRLPPPGR
mmetsp:Transcript_12867/g.45613  ORF Transcript_12867/g.45613 Transcript_12867/m.45613 type:complete len:223 (+) Transcript_12867:188-856(+)